MTGHGNVKALEEKEARLFDDETIYDYLIQRSNELEHEAMMIQEILKFIRELNLKSQNQSLKTNEIKGFKQYGNIYINQEEK